MSYIAIDYGKKRIGVAYSDESKTFAMPHSVIVNDKNCLEAVEAILIEKKAEKIVMGHSVDLKRQPNKVQEDIDEFKKELTEFFEKKGRVVDIVDQDEFLTSAHVEIKNDMLDASAAALILQRYLDTENYKNQNPKS